jgi:hypothetical protein
MNVKHILCALLDLAQVENAQKIKGRCANVRGSTEKLLTVCGAK